MCVSVDDIPVPSLPPAQGMAWPPAVPSHMHDKDGSGFWDRSFLDTGSAASCHSSLIYSVPGWLAEASLDIISNP